MAITIVGTSKLAAGAVEIPILGTLFDDMMDRVQTTMDGVIGRATGALTEIELEAGRQVALAIQNAKNAYLEILDKTVDKVDKAVTDRLSDLTAMIEEFQAENQAFLEEAAERAQQLINSLPFSNLQPQLTGAKPRNIVVGGNPNEIFTFTGNFPFSADPKFPPSLTFENKKFSVVGSTTQKLEFQVPVSDVFPVGDSNSTPIHSYSYKSGELQIPWDNTSNLPIWKRLLGYTDYKTYSYKALVAALPLSPGRITAIYTKKVDGPVTRQRFASKPVHEDANHAYKKHCKDWDVHNFTYKPDDGFRFIVGTQALVLDTNLQRPHGNHQESITRVSEDAIDAQIKMDACSGKHMGIITFHVECDEVKTTSVDQLTQIPVEMKWGETRTLDMKTADGLLSQIVFNSFDNKQYEFGTVTDIKNKYLKIYNQSDKIQIAATAPTDLLSMRLVKAVKKN